MREHFIYFMLAIFHYTLSKARSAFGSELALFAFCEWRLELSYLLVGIVVYGGMQLAQLCP